MDLRWKNNATWELANGNVYVETIVNKYSIIYYQTEVILSVQQLYKV